jgi:hypothetical protein
MKCVFSVVLAESWQDQGFNSTLPFALFQLSFTLFATLEK